MGGEGGEGWGAVAKKMRGWSRGAQGFLWSEGVQESWGGFHKCREGEARRLGGMQAEVQGEGRPPGWWRSLAGCRSREEAVNKAAQAPLVPMGAGLGPPAWAPPRGRWAQGRSQQEEKSPSAGQSPSLIHCGRGGLQGRDSGRQGDTKEERWDRQERAGQGLVKLLMPTLPTPPCWSQAPNLPPKLMTQEAMMMRTPPTRATMLKSLATRPKRWAPSTSPCCRLFRD